MARLSALGDVAMTIPVLYSVCQTNPQIRFLLLTKPFPAKVFINTPENLTVVPVDFDRYKGIGGLRRLHKELIREYDIDAFADLHDVLRTKILRLFFRLSGRRVARIHKGRRGKRALTRRSHKVMLPLITSRARYREVFWKLGIPREDTFHNLFTADHPASPEVYAAATTPRREGETWIAIAPFAQHPGKIYPPHLMEQVVGELASRPGYSIFLFGAGAGEHQTLSEWHRKYPDQTVDMSELRLGIPAELNLLHDCDAMISMDSANMHMASVVGLPVVSVWGATHPYCGFTGWRQDKQDIVQLDMVCRPCSVFGNKPCHRGDMHCLYGIQPAYIISKLDALLARRAK